MDDHLSIDMPRNFFCHADTLWWDIIVAGSQTNLCCRWGCFHQHMHVASRVCSHWPWLLLLPSRGADDGSWAWRSLGHHDEAGSSIGCQQMWWKVQGMCPLANLLLYAFTERGSFAHSCQNSSSRSHRMPWPILPLSERLGMLHSVGPLPRDSKQLFNVQAWKAWLYLCAEYAGSHAVNPCQVQGLCYLGRCLAVYQVCVHALWLICREEEYWQIQGERPSFQVFSCIENSVIFSRLFCLGYLVCNQVETAYPRDAFLSQKILEVLYSSFDLLIARHDLPSLVCDWLLPEFHRTDKRG